MAELIRLDADRALQHATRVEATAARVSTAASAAGSMNMSGGAFGLMCSFLVPPATLASSLARDTLLSSQQLIERSARELRAAVADISAGEERVMQDVAALERGFDGPGA